MVEIMRTLLLNIAIVLSFGFGQHVTLYLNQVIYSDSDDSVDIYINMDSDAPIASFYFTLNGFENILSTSSLSPLCLAEQYLESLSFVEGYFSGGDTDNAPIPMGSGPFLTINANYNSMYLDGQHLTIKDVSPGYNNQETHFYTYNSDGLLVEMSYDWAPMTWVLGTDSISPWVGQDCMGDIWGTAFEDDCGVCSEGTSGHIENSDIDCAGNCFGADVVDACGICAGDASTCTDDCGIVNGDNSSCSDECGIPNGNNSTCVDCAGIPNGETIEANWYADCDIDGLADNTIAIALCGYPTENDIQSACGQTPNCSSNENVLCGLISIDPNNHTFDANPECTSNSIDTCGICDGFNQYLDCNGLCPGSQGYIGPGIAGELESFSDSDYGYDNCGVCGGNDSSCTGCTDSNATNYCSDCLIYDGSCTFELYPGDVNRDGFVDEKDVDGLGIFWHQQGTPRDHESIGWYRQYATDDWQDICAAYADTNGDGYIDHLDLSAILYNWGNEANYEFSNQPSLCYELNDAGAYRHNFEDILSFLDQEESENHTIRSMINHISDLLNLEYFPDSFKLYQNYPNPFNPVTTISFDVEQSSDLFLSVHDIKGNLVYQHDFGYLDPGLFNYVLNAKEFTSGMYIYSISSSLGFIAHKQMILIK